MHIGNQILVGESESIQKIRELIRQVVHSDLNVLICGETGVGKEVVARALHLMSGRRNKPLVKVNCSAIPSQLLESELFGYEKGAFTGADRTKIGKFELAHEGTILLDEIGDMPLPLQAKMLQVLQDYQFSRLGSKRDVKVDCWVLAATNQDLEQRIEECLFREDLYYRLNIIRIYIPPLRERREDIKPLIHYFSGQSAEKPRIKFGDNGVVDFLCQYSWPGNVRELQNVVKRLMLLGDWENVKAELMGRETKDAGVHEPATESSSLIASELGNELLAGGKFPPLKEVKKKAIRKAEAKLIGAVLEETRWNRKQAAKILKISYKALLYKIKGYDLERKH